MKTLVRSSKAYVSGFIKRNIAYWVYFFALGATCYLLISGSTKVVFYAGSPQDSRAPIWFQVHEVHRQLHDFNKNKSDSDDVDNPTKINNHNIDPDCALVTKDVASLTWLCDRHNDLTEVDAKTWWKTRFTEDEKNSMSSVGRHIFLGDRFSEKNNSDKAAKTILVWKYGPQVEKRLLYNYSNKITDPFRDEICQASNCKLSFEPDTLDEADAVFIHLHRTKGVSDLPERRGRNPNQKWVFLTDESLKNIFYSNPSLQIQDFNGLFNWSMSYHHFNDVPVPYGRVVPKGLASKNDQIQNDFDPTINKTKLAAVMTSNCMKGSKRWAYIEAINKTLMDDFDIWGGCGDHKCPGAFTKNCDGINVYKFYMAFENTQCSEYITEKLWWNAFKKGSVPIVMGSKYEDYAKVAPPRSFIFADHFKNVDQLSKLLLFLNARPEFYAKFHQWRQNFVALNEHAFFGSAPSKHFCRICEALHFNADANLKKSYSHLEEFWDKKTACFSTLNSEAAKWTGSNPK